MDQRLYDCMNVRPEYLGAEGALMPMLQHISSQRAEMFSSHITQAVVLHNPEMPKIASGFEAVVGKYPFGVLDIDEDIYIHKSIPAFQNTLITKGTNPSLMIVYIGVDSGTFGYISLTNYTMSSQCFGYMNHWEGGHHHRKDAYIPRDQKKTFSHAPNQEGDVFKYGVNLNVLYCTQWGVTEDATIISESTAEKLKYSAVETKTINIKKSDIPLNLYGDEETYRIMPDINEHINSDGILLATRDTRDPALFAYDYTDNAMMPQIYDDLYRAPPQALVTDIKVYIGMKQDEGVANDIVYEQLVKYQKEQVDYYLSVLQTYYELTEQGYQPDDRMRSQVEYAMRMIFAENSKNKLDLNKKMDKQSKRKLLNDLYKLGNKRLQLFDKKEPIDGIKIEITYTYEVKPGKGYKITGRDGSKGVISDVWPDECMGEDEFGNQVDMIQSCSGVFNRMNTGQNNEHFLTRAMNDVEQLIKNTVSDLEAYKLLIDFLNDIWPEYAQKISEEYGQTEESISSLITQVRNEGIQLVLLPFLYVDYEEIVKNVRHKWNIQPSHITFRQKVADNHYETVKTKEKFLIGSKYVMLLYKVPYVDEYAVELSYVSQFEVPVRPKDKQKAMDPMKRTPIRFGEDEASLLIMSVGKDETTRFTGIYGGGSVEAVQNLSEKLLTADKPTQIGRCDLSTQEILDTNVNAKTLHHLFGCAGINLNGDMQE